MTKSVYVKTRERGIFGKKPHEVFSLLLQKKLIGHLKLTFEAKRPPPPQLFQQDLLRAAEESGEYF